MKKFLLIASLFLLLPFTACSSKKTGDSDGLSENDLNGGKDRFGKGGIPYAEGEGMFHDVHFEYDSADLSSDAEADIDFNVNVLNQNSEAKVTLEGHTDDRGTNDYNMSLGASRARTVMKKLIVAGISSSRLDAVSYGEEVPLVTGANEDAWVKNRRVHFGVK